MKNRLEEAFAENNIDFDNNDYLLMALLKRMTALLDTNKENFDLIMERLKELEGNIKPRTFATQG